MTLNASKGRQRLPIAIRRANAADMRTICEIVNHYIATTAVNFRTEPQSVREWEADWQQYRERYPWLVASSAERVAGVAYAAPWKARAAYDWCAEVTVYVAADCLRQGVGSLLYHRLLADLEAQGFQTAVAAIGLPNEPSVALHEALGFRHAGMLKRVGYKFGAWHDVGFWQKAISEVDEPKPLRLVADG